ncbi:hypothetical protein [Terriglobus aquaticus]|uniref:Uncharacterized protein n=1 Tax=Terriglobus aquaticus TaxID=940139 RepID=A0ABW9KHN8_9BACT|nr:hypothetical protein [Terriglobus aquaticus]
MRRSALPALFLPLSIAALPTLAQQATRSAPVGPTALHRAANATHEGSESLPIRRVALYKNGVGFFEHSGTVRGDQAVTIDFTTAQLNDVLQSLTAVDLGGGRSRALGTTAPRLWTSS